MWASSIPHRPRMMFSSPTHARRGLFRSDARLGGMNFTDAPGCYEPEEGKAAFLGMDLTKAAMRGPARAKA
jgi:hypothetical protein